MQLKYKNLPYINPKNIMQLVAKESGTIFLDSSSDNDHYGRYSFILINPVVTFLSGGGDGDSGRDVSINLKQQFSDLYLLLKENYQDISNHHPADLPPFTGGVAGYFGYALGHKLEGIPGIRDNTVPDYSLGLYNQVIAFDVINRKCYIIVCEISGYSFDLDMLLNELNEIYNQAAARGEGEQCNTKTSALAPLTLRSNFDLAGYTAIIERAQAYIRSGDIFEVNLAQCFSATASHDYDLWQLYQIIREYNSAPFSAYLNLGELKIGSCSPERFIALRDKKIEVRPIKGTINRVADAKLDHLLQEKLLNSAKDIAENIMIVDLMRNDLSKVCTPDSVIVTSLCELESFSNVHHLVSVIEGYLAPDKTPLDAVLACFPGGSVTGAPKIRAMEIIDELEPCSRGVYCGSIGYLGFNQNVDLSIAIRTIVQCKNELSFAVGGAITLDSNAPDEYNETLIKGNKLKQIIEAYDDTTISTNN